MDELTEAGRVGADEVWARITYFLDRVVPVAEEYKVRIACHPNDPLLPAQYADDRYEVTDKGKAAAELGFYEV